VTAKKAEIDQNQEATKEEKDAAKAKVDEEAIIIRCRLVNVIFSFCCFFIYFCFRCVFFFFSSFLNQKLLKKQKQNKQLMMQ
jgi:hypothetical protein